MPTPLTGAAVRFEDDELALQIELHGHRASRPCGAVAGGGKTDDEPPGPAVAGEVEGSGTPDLR